MSLARTLSFAAAAISSAASGSDFARAAAIAFRSANPNCGTAREVEVNRDRGTADLFPAEITESQIAWHDTLRGGYYYLERASGAPTFLNAPSTGG